MGRRTLSLLTGLLSCALMSVGMLLFGVVTLLANWATAWLYLRGYQGGVVR